MEADLAVDARCAGALGDVSQSLDLSVVLIDLRVTATELDRVPLPPAMPAHLSSAARVTVLIESERDLGLLTSRYRQLASTFALVVPELGTPAALAAFLALRRSTEPALDWRLVRLAPALALRRKEVDALVGPRSAVEIVFRDFLLDGTRRDAIRQVQTLARWTRGRRLIVTSGARGTAELRSSADMRHAVSTLAMSPCGARRMAAFMASEEAALVADLVAQQLI